MERDDSRSTSQNDQDSCRKDRKLERALWELRSISQSCRTLGWKEARSRYTEALTRLGEEHFVSKRLLKEFQKSTTTFIGGDEHINLRIVSDRSRIYKITQDESFGYCPYFNLVDHERTGDHFITCTNGISSLMPFRETSEFKIASLPHSMPSLRLHLITSVSGYTKKSIN